MSFPPSLYRTPLQVNGYVPRVWQEFFKKAIGKFPNSLAQTPIVKQDGTMQYVWINVLRKAQPKFPESLARTPLHEENGLPNRQWLKYLQTL